ncbi:LLM class F420-dependent oxidoreductase [Rhabdothermincola sediminis]|uniref:LLM class F420-dependent oxidoreductase n=1 Tax=Rhabdothermincola sediminis TaxID=2751370 RepID=UPI001AA034A0|nr:LLM class F420-dependent oxidoreductase [Rhabdothermincola sediminis]
MTRLGIITPVVTLNPRAHNPWEERAGVDEVVAVAQAADRLGFHHLTCSEHVAVSSAYDDTRGTRYWDPSATLSFLAARTQRIRLATHVLVLAYHHPLAIVKRYGTLDLLSGGRLILGVGVGSLREEFELLGASFEDRGRRADETLGVLRASFGRREVDGFVVDPSGVQRPPPIWVGGRSARSLRRAVELGDGWVPFGLATAQVREMLDRARGSEAWARRAQALEVVLWPEPPIDPLGDPAGAEQAIAAAVEAGATVVNLRFRSRSLAHHLEQMEAMAALR